MRTLRRPFDLFSPASRKGRWREHDRVLPFEQIRWLKDAGFGAVRAPQEHGGRGAGLPELFALLTELAEADSNLTQALRVHFAFAKDVLNSRDQARRELWLNRFANGEILGGAWTEVGDAKMASFSTRVRATNGRLSLTGAKFAPARGASGGDVCTHFRDAWAPVGRGFPTVSSTPSPP